MKLCNDTITVFNARVDPAEGGNVWTPTVITGASWYMTDASTVDTGKGGLVAANKVTVRIPADADTGVKAWADPVAYANADSVSGLWTLKAGDVVVKGDASGLANPTPARLKAACADCAVILGVTDNRRALNAPHWRITAT